MINKVLCKETNELVELIHQGFDIAIIKRDGINNQECVSIKTLEVKKRDRPLNIWGERKSKK
jgi:hypothetical protein